MARTLKSVKRVNRARTVSIGGSDKSQQSITESPIKRAPVDKAGKKQTSPRKKVIRTKLPTPENIETTAVDVNATAAIPTKTPKVKAPKKSKVSKKVAPIAITKQVFLDNKEATEIVQDIKATKKSGYLSRIADYITSVFGLKA